MNLRRSVLDTTFLVISEYADVGLDMAPPIVGFTLNSGGAGPDVWYQTSWVPGENTTVMSDPTSPFNGQYMRRHRILIGPNAAADLALGVGRWVVWRQLTDTPEVPAGVVGGTITIY